MTRHRAPQVQSEPGTGRRGRGGRSGASNGNGNGQQQRQPQQQNGGSNGTHAITDDVRNALAMVAAKTVPHHEHEDPTPADVPVEILDIPVVKSSRGGRKPRTADAEVILDSVLEALPEPKQPGQGRARTSRRASSAGNVVSAPISED